MNLLISVMLWRGILFFAAYIVESVFTFTPKFPYSDIYLNPSGLPKWIWSWGNFDGVHYLTIIQRGYFAQFTQAFFPLFPIVVRILGLIIHDKNFIISALLISVVSFYLFIHFLQKLLSFDYKKSVILKTILFIFLFPTGFYFFGIYSESFFLLLVCLAFLTARQKKWFLSAVFASLAGATRIYGILLLPALLVEWINNSETKLISMSVMMKLKTYLILIFKSPYLYIAPLGLLIYMVYLEFKFGDALLFWHAQSAFGASRQTSIILPPQVIWRYIKILLTVSINADSFGIALVEFLSFMLGVGVLIVGHFRKIRTSYLVYGWLALILPTLTGTFSSLPRYLLVIFPLYIVFGLIHSKKLLTLLALIFIMLQIIFMSQFLRGLWIS